MGDNDLWKIAGKSIEKQKDWKMTHFITLPAILIFMQVLWYLAFFVSSLAARNQNLL